MQRRATQFLNVDLDVESRRPLRNLVEALPSMFILFSGRVRGKHALSMELDGRSQLSLDATLRRMARTVSRLSGEPRRLWRGATRRCFNIGFACGDDRVPAFRITPTTIEAIAAVGGSVELTLYPAEPEIPRSRPAARPRPHS